MNPDPDTWWKGILKPWASPVYTCSSGTREIKVRLYRLDSKNTVNSARFYANTCSALLKRTLQKKCCNKQEENFFHFGFVLFCSVSYRFVQGISTTVRAMPRQWNGMRSSSQIYLVRKKRREGKTRKKEKKKTNRRTKGGGGARACFTSRSIAGSSCRPLS